MFNSKKKSNKGLDRPTTHTHSSIETVGEACTETLGEMTDERFEEIMKPRGHHKVNPIISIRSLDMNNPVIINNETGESQNTYTYYGELLSNVRSRAKCLEERKGLEYEVIMAKDTPDDQKVDLLISNMESTDATLSVVLADDILTCLKSVACNIEGKIMMFLESNGLEGDCGYSIKVLEQDFLIGMFSYRYPNHNIPTYEISAATYFDFVANRKLQIMNNFCGEVYNFIRTIAYDPYLDLGNFDSYPGAHDTLYATLCDFVYNDLACLDDALTALITAHCIRIENCYTPARDAYESMMDQKRQQAKLPSQTKK